MGGRTSNIRLLSRRRRYDLGLIILDAVHEVRDRVGLHLISGMGYQEGLQLLRTQLTSYPSALGPLWQDHQGSPLQPETI